MEAPPIAVSRVAFGYGRAGHGRASSGPEEVLQDVSLTVAAGRLTALLGPNGAGKSTLFRLIVGRLQPLRGEISIFGQPAASLDSVSRARLVGYLPQEVRAAFGFSVGEVVLMGRYPHLRFGLESAHDRGVASRCLERTDTAHLAARRFDTLSGGERQRVLLAAALAQEPRILLLDEPTAALDWHHQHEVLALLDSLAAEGLAICLVTHDLNLAARYCHQLYLLEAGRIAAAGGPDEVLRGPALRRVYGQALRVIDDPDLGRPLILGPLPGEAPCPPA